jgi:hypothetical protein
MSIWELSSLLVRNLAELEQAIQEAAVAQEARTRVATPTLFWRGHEDEQWNIVPQVYRSPKFREADLIWGFVTRGSPRIPNPPPVTDKLGWIHLAQHYGLPTRLLDWSFSPLPALYFAIANPILDDRNGCIWSLDPHALNLSANGNPGLLVPTATIVGTMIDEAFVTPTSATGAPQGLGSPTAPVAPLAPQLPLPPIEPPPSPKLSGQSVAAMVAHEIDLRMLVQQAAFTIHRNGTDLRDFDEQTAMLKKFIVPKESKKFLRSWLRRAGVSGATLFPDLSGLARDLRMRYEDLS